MNALRRPVVLGVALMALNVPTFSQACASREPTLQTGPGPHDFQVAPAVNELWREGDAGEPLVLHLRVLDTCGDPVEGATVQILHADQDGRHDPERWRAHLSTDQRGVLDVITVYPGYAGGMARHVHFIITHPSHGRLVTRLFFKSDPMVAQQDRGSLMLVPEEIRHGRQRRWAAGYEFVLPPLVK